MRRHSVCIHNPPCCYITDGGTDSSQTECCFPQCKNHPKKKRSYNVNIPRHSKRQDALLISKHGYGPRYSSLKCNKTRTQLLNYENRVVRQDLKRTKHKSAKILDEASSYDVGSVSSHCTSLSVDVSHEMAAVNKDIEALLARYEKAFVEEKNNDILVPRFKVTDKGRLHKPKKENLTVEQMKLLSMDKPPLDKLKELPYEYLENLKPRPPSHLNKEKVSVNNKMGKKNLKESLEAFIQKEQGGGNSKSDLLESMWQDVIERGLTKEDLNKNIKPIYTSMTLDENASLNINFGKPYPVQETQQKKGTSRGTVISPRMKTNPSVATQTSCDYDVMSRIKAASSITAGSNKKIEGFRKKSVSDCSPDLKNWKGILEDINIGDSQQKNAKPATPPQLSKPSGDSINNNPKEILSNLFENKTDSTNKQKFLPLNHRELNVYNVHTPETINNLKKNDWFKIQSDHLITPDNLLPKKHTEINNEKMISMINKTMHREKDSMYQFSNKEKITEEAGEYENLPKNSSQFTVQSTEKNVISSTDRLKECSENISSVPKCTSNITDQEAKIGYSVIQTVNLDLKYMKENCDGLDTPLCVEIIKRLTDTMLKCEPGKISDELTTRNCYLYLEELRKLRAQHLRHIQNEVKHIEELDKSLKKYYSENVKE